MNVVIAQTNSLYWSNNTSAAPGYLTPITAAPLEGDALDDFLQAVIVAITSIPPQLVRPRWQPTPPTQPPVSTDWCAFGVTALLADAGPYIGHAPGVDHLQRHQQLHMLLSFYGPNGSSNAKRMRDDITVAQNREKLRANNISFVRTGDIQVLPDLVAQQWVKRHELEVVLTQQISRDYAVLDIESLDGEIRTESFAEPI